VCASQHCLDFVSWNVSDHHGGARSGFDLLRHFSPPVAAAPVTLLDDRPEVQLSGVE
jgi:hypothetical protein